MWGSSRDVSFFRHINREMFGRILQQEADIYKAAIYREDINLYGETLNKLFYKGVRFAGLVGTESETVEYEDNNLDTSQSAIFRFLRDDLKIRSIVLEIGDIIHWDNKYWEVDNTNESNYFMGRNPDTNKSIGSDFGWNISVVCPCHLTKKSTISKIERVRSGKNTQNKSTKKKNNLY